LAAINGLFAANNYLVVMLTISVSADLPLTVDDLKTFLHITSADDDVQLLRCLRAGINLVEHAAERDIVRRQVAEQFVCWQTLLPLRRSPIISIDLVTYIDQFEMSQTFTDYKLVTSVFTRGRLAIAADNIPSSIGGPTVMYSVGMPETSPITDQAILWAAAHLYLHREFEIVGAAVDQLSVGFQRLINHIKAGGYA
jgi:uncharacterized phiE125 gp8 family phage protein